MNAMRQVVLVALGMALLGCKNDTRKVEPPKPEAVQTIQTEIQQMTQGRTEREKQFEEASKQLAEKSNSGDSLEIKKKQKMVSDLNKKAEYLKTTASELESVLEGLVADYKSGKITEAEFQKQYDDIKAQNSDMSGSLDEYIQILKKAAN